MAERDRDDDAFRAAAAEQELRRSNAKVAAILEIAADAIIALDADMNITQFNEGAAAMFGYGKNELIGEKLEVLIPERFRKSHFQHVAGFASSGVASRRMGERREIYAVRKSGEEFPAEASIAQLRFEDERIYLVVLRDVTERKRTEALLARSNLELEARVAQRTRALIEESKRREAAQSALIQAQRMEAFGQLTGGIAHDFNNLLTIVLGNIERLEPAVGGEERAILQRASDAAQMGARLTGRLLSFARRRPLAPSVINVNEIVLGIAELLKRSLGERVTLTTVLEGNLWATRADASELENAVLNLAINARDAMPEGGKLVIETRNRTFEEGMFADNPTGPVSPGEYVCICVTDTGTGMTPDVLKHAFEPFFTTKEGHGTGLGLSTIYGFANQSGGHVVAESEPGKGTVIRILLPRESTRSEAVSEGDIAVPLSENAEAVLVVEDDPGVRELSLQRVEGLGYVAIEAANAEAAIEIIQKQPVDLVFSDIGLGRGMSGFELARWVRNRRPQVKVLLTTGHITGPEAEGGAREGFAILQKPYSRLQLAVALQDALTAKA
jgi:PAS domain S-box-containing protein